MGMEEIIVGVVGVLQFDVLKIPSKICDCILQGMHHSAQKSKSTGTSDARTSVSKLSLVIVTISI